jgi:outer membrane protein TolC
VAGYQVIAATAATRTANAARYPTLNLSGTLGASSASARKVFSPEVLAASIASGLSAPVFDAGRLNSNLEAAKAVRDQSVENFSSTVLTALAETENALIACRRSAERLVILEKAASLAREADLLARQRYQAGEIDFSDVLDTQRSLLGLEESLLGTRADRTISYIRLYQALGGGWSPA